MQHYDETKELALFTDSSKHHWSLIAAQVDCIPTDEEVMRDVHSLNIKPLIFLSGKFKPDQESWHISQKELHPIIYAYKMLDYLVRGNRNPYTSTPTTRT